MSRKFGLIGYPLSHSFSPSYFNTKFQLENIDAQYDIYPLEDIHDWCPLIQSHSFSGINVTLPYKKSILPFLDEITAVALEIGSVNTIKFQKNKTIGYNTDAYGFEKSLLPFISTAQNIEEALVLGSGGASAAVVHVLESLQIPFEIVGREATKSTFTYENIPLSFFEKKGLIINTTPLGMYPQIDSCPRLPYDLLTQNTYLYDLVYNPEVTTFLSKGMEKGCPTKNGYDMLIFQAEKAWEIWNE